jgi:hypothetical protein
MKKLPRNPTGWNNLDQAYQGMRRIGHWAQNVGCINVANYAYHCARLAKEELNKQAKRDGRAV